MEGKKVEHEPQPRDLRRATSSSRYDPDPLRYYLTAAGPETQDTDFTWEEFVRRNNDELLANWGNLVNRTLVSAHRNFGEVPRAGRAHRRPTRRCSTRSRRRSTTVGGLIEAARFKAALAEAMRRQLAREPVRRATRQPWALVKTDRDRAATVLYVALRAVDSLKTLFTPFLPFTSQTRARAARLRRLARRAARVPSTIDRGGRLDARRPDRRLRRAGSARGSRASSRPVRRCASRSRSSASSTPETVDEELARLERRLARDRHARAPRRARRRSGGRSSRARARGRRRRASSPSARRRPAAAARSSSRTRTTASSRSSASTRTRPATTTDADVAELRGAARPPEGRRGRRDRARLLPRLRAARRAAAPVRRAARARRRARQAGRHPHPRGRRRHARGARRLRRHGRPALLLLAEPARAGRVERGWYVSFAGNVTFPKAVELRLAATQVPADRILAETDSPYLAPQPVRGRPERAGVRRAHARRARGGARGGRGRSSSARIDAQRDRVLRPAGMSVSPKKELGQHFLVDENILGVIGRLAELAPDDVVLEIGPGLGVLTRYLAQRVAHVHAVELDRSLEPHLADAGRERRRSTSATRSGSTSPRSRRARRSSSRTCRTTSPRRSSSRASTGCRSSSCWCVMVQREVADRFFAAPVDEGVRRRLGARAARRRAHRLPPGLARRSSGRAPNVDSALVAFRRTGMPPDYPRVKKVVAAAFAHRRKTLPNSLELAGRRRRRDARGGGARRGSAASRPSARRRSRRPSSSRSPRRSGEGAGARRRSTSRSSSGRYARDGKHELLTVYQRLALADRIELEPADDGLRVDGFADDTLVRGALERSPRAPAPSPRWRVPDREAAPGRGRARRRQLRRRDGAPARQRDAPRAARRRRRCTSSRRRSAPTSRSSSTTGPQLGTGDGTTLAPLDLPQDFWVVLVLPRRRARRPSTAAVYAAFDERDGAAGFDERRAAFLAALDAVRRPRDLAALPPNDLASSPLDRRAARARRLPRRRHRRRSRRLRALPSPRARGGRRVR